MTSRSEAWALLQRAMADAAVTAHARAGRPIVLGIAGAQGSGKTTLARALVEELAGRRMAAVGLSLDDLYLTRAEREALARDVHPLLETRGVPGTHDLPLARRTLDALLGARPGEEVPYPSFDKARDDRRDPESWPRAVGPLHVIVLEGWCLGAEPESEARLAEPCNALERRCDPDGAWRHHVNAQLAGDYRALFARLDVLVFLAAPDLDSVRRWRARQEAELSARAGAGATAVMDAAGLDRFLQHFERITRAMLRRTPARTHAVVELGPDHEVKGVRLR